MRFLASAQERIQGTITAVVNRSEFELYASPNRGQARIADVQVMMLQGPRTHTIVNVIGDQLLELACVLTRNLIFRAANEGCLLDETLRSTEPRRLAVPRS